MNVPTPTELTGDLSSFTDQIYNPYSTAADGSRQPFMCDAAGNPTAVQADNTQAPGTPCNKIPSALIDSNMVTVANAIYPALVDTGNPAFNALNNSPAINNNNEYSMRVDEQWRQNDAFWWRFTHTNAPSTSSGAFPGLLSQASYYAFQMVSGWRHTFGSSAVLDVNFGRDKGTDSNHTLLQRVNGGDLAKQAGFATDFACRFEYSSRSCLLPNINFNSGGFASGGENNSYDQMQNIYEWRANFSKMFKRHMVSVGADFNYDGLNGGSGWIDTNANSYVSFDSSQTANNGNGGVALGS